MAPSFTGVWWIPLGVFLSATLSMSDRIAAQSDSAEMRRIKDAHLKWMRSVVSLHLKCEIVFDRRPGTDGDGGKHILEWAWTDTGRWRHHSTSFRNRKVEHRIMFLDDAERFYRVSFPRGESSASQPQEVTINSTVGGSEVLVTPLFGLWFPRHSQWLGQLLDAGKGRIEGHETVDGARCPKVRVERAPGIFETVTLDPRHGYLPIRTSTGEKPKHQWVLRVRKYRKLRPGIWIPESGEFSTEVSGSIDVEKWRVASVTLNRTLPVSLFRPKIPRGTRVNDSILGKRYIQGVVNRRPTGRELSQEAKRNLSEPGSQGSDVSGVPRPFFWRRWGSVVLVCLSTALIGVAAWLHFRKRSNPQSEQETES